MWTVGEIAERCKALLEAHYGSRLEGVVLYGSAARGQARMDSDVDLLVLLDGPFNYFQELYRIVDLLYPVQLESDRLISAKPAAVEDFRQGKLQLYRNVWREGVFL